MNDTEEQGGTMDADANPADARARGKAARVRRWMAARWDVLVCLFILAAMSAVMLDTIRRKSLTVDEYVMIPSAYYHVAEGEFRLIHEHPPLSKMLAGLPLLFFDRVESLRQGQAAPPETIQTRGIYYDHFWVRNGQQYRAICYWTRVPLVALTAALGLLVFVFARSLFGAWAALLAVALFSLEPTVLAHGRVVQTDIPATFGYLFVVYVLYLYLMKLTPGRALLLGAAGGVAVLAKFSMLLVGPAFVLVFAVLLWRGPRHGLKRRAVLAQTLVAAAGLLAVIWAGYFFHSRPLGEADRRWMTESFGETAGIITSASGALSYLFPTDFVLGILYQLWHARAGHQASLLGMYSSTGWWYYFPVAFTLKTTLPFLLLSLASLGWGAWRLWRERDRRFLFLLIPFGLYTLYVMASPINIGIRYYLPAYPFLFVGGGALLARLAPLSRLSRLTKWRGIGGAERAGLLAFVLLLGWVGAEAVRTFPHYMSYMNQLAVGRPHWWYLSDSNVEWGDDARELSLYLRRQGVRRVRGAFFTGWVTTRYYGVEYVDMLSPDKTRQVPTSYTAIGASFLNGSAVPTPIVNGQPVSEEERVNFFAAYRNRTPEKIFGNSIYLFREDK
jgi:4-amino-4-deoxy-L-arabinose transferase-like glycosyltransferase